MTQEKLIKYWKNGAKRDLKTAESLFKTKRYDWCLFIAHLVLEKILKALYIQNNGKNVPPKIHNLVKLAELSSIDLTEEKRIFFDEVNDFNLEARYPDYKNEFYNRCTKKFTEKYFKQIKEYYTWLKSLLEYKK